MSGDYENGEEEERKSGGSKKSNILPLWGNERSMNLNPLILTNIQSSHYFKVNLYELKTYHEVIDEIYYKVAHLEPWEKGSRKTSGQTGMCGGVRGVGAGGIVSTAYCLLYKLFTLKLTRKQLNGLITHPDSPYIRALGFMYIRYTQPPADLWDWYDEYLEDSEELDVKAGGGQVMTIGAILRSFLSKLEWFSTLFPRIPVPIQQKIEKNLNNKFINQKPVPAVKPREAGDQERLTARYRERTPERDRRDPDRREPDRKVTERRDTDRRDIDRRETDRRDADRRDMDRRDTDRRDVDRRDTDRRDTDRRDVDRRDTDRRDTDRREVDKWDGDRQKSERREGERKCRRKVETNGSRNYDKYSERDRYLDREYTRSSESSRSIRDHREKRSRERERHRSRSRDRHHSRVY